MVEKLKVKAEDVLDALERVQDPRVAIAVALVVAQRRGEEIAHGPTEIEGVTQKMVRSAAKALRQAQESLDLALVLLGVQTAGDDDKVSANACNALLAMELELRDIDVGL